MPDLEIVNGNTMMVGTRRKRDTSIEDALKTMERFSDWLGAAHEQNPWQECDALNTAMLYGMLLHLREEIDHLIALGGKEARHTYEFFNRGPSQ